MPSPLATAAAAPASGSAAQTDDFLVSSPRTTQGASSFQNGVNGDGAVQQPDTNPAIDGPDTAVDGPDLIREGKEKAKAIMAASGVPVDGEVGQSSIPLPDTISPATTGTIQGPSPSRKRSRSGSRLPSQTPAHDIQVPDEEDELSINDYQLKQVIFRDQLYAEALVKQENGANRLLQHKKQEKEYYEQLSLQRHQRRVHPGQLFGYGYQGYGNGATESKVPAVRYPDQRKRPGNRHSRPIRISRKDRLAQAEQIEELVPVRLDIELDKIKLRDTFTWNLHDRVIPTDVFAENLVEDFNLPMEMRGPLIHQINRELQEQIQDFYPHVFFDEEPLDPSLPYSAYKNDEMRILIKLNITIGQHTLVDQFEWEINNPDNSPEEFARQMARDLALSGEFTTAIAHSIREQTQMFTKSLYITGHPFDGRPVEDADIRDSFLPSPLPLVFRPMQSAKDYQPYLYELNEVELERTELSILREQRRQKRSVNRRGGPALPDLKDRQRTVRTLVVSSVLPGASETIEESRVFKVSRASGRGRRTGGPTDPDNSDESDSEMSGVESPGPSQITGGTARTRNMRGAASAAQAAMRATIGRSQTPELSSLHHHETRTSRRLGTHDTREESVTEPQSLIVKLRISTKRLREWVENLNNPKPKDSTPKPTSTPVMKPTPLPARATAAANSMPPPPSPAMAPRSTPTPSAPSAEPSPRLPSAPTSNNQSNQWKYYPDGRADAPFPILHGTPSVRKRLHLFEVIANFDRLPPLPGWRTRLQTSVSNTRMICLKQLCAITS